MYTGAHGDERAGQVTESQMPSIPGFSGFTKIGSGGFATVYSATEDFFDRPVAVKVLEQRLDGPHRHRFERECRTMARLSDHPNVVTLYSAGYTQDERPFIVMELVAGGSLAERLQAEGPFDWPQVQHIGVKLADALSNAHQAGVLHRDIKPENVLLIGAEPKLTDFGIASFLDSSGATSTSISVSWSHAPPETFENIRDERSDLYSLASTLYTLLAGTSPFFRAGEDSLNPLLKRLLNDEPQGIGRLDVPQDLQSVISETLRKNPDDRPQTAAVLSQRLAEIRADQQTSTAKMSHVSGSQPRSNDTTRIMPMSSGRRRNVVALVGVAMLIAAVVAGAGGLLLQTRSDSGSNVEEAGPAMTETPASPVTDELEPSGSAQATSPTVPPTLISAETSTLRSTEALLGPDSSSTTTAAPTTQPTTAAPTTQPTTASTAAPITQPTTASTAAPTTRTTEVSAPPPPAKPNPSVSIGLNSLAAGWAPPDRPLTYSYWVTMDGTQVHAVTTEDIFANYQYGGFRTGNICFHLTALDELGQSSPVSTTCEIVS